MHCQKFPPAAADRRRPAAEAQRACQHALAAPSWHGRAGRRAARQRAGGGRQQAEGGEKSVLKRAWRAGQQIGAAKPMHGWQVDWPCNNHQSNGASRPPQLQLHAASDLPPRHGGWQPAACNPATRLAGCSKDAGILSTPPGASMRRHSRHKSTHKMQSGAAVAADAPLKQLQLQQQQS